MAVTLKTPLIISKYNDLEDVSDGVCNGVGCCEASFPDGVKNISVTIDSSWNHRKVSFNPCSAAFPVAIDAFTYNKKNLTQQVDYYLRGPELPLVLNWAIGTDNCSVAQANGDYLCKNNTICDHPHKQVGYRCKCKDGYTGNPYLHQGCTGKQMEQQQPIEPASVSVQAVKAVPKQKSEMDIPI